MNIDFYKNIIFCMLIHVKLSTKNKDKCPQLNNLMYIHYMVQENRDQIPKNEGPESQTGKMINEQNATEGQRKEVNVENYAVVSEIGQSLKDLDFPADKNKILEFIRSHQAIQNKQKILDALNNLQDKSYSNVSDITTSAGLVHQ